MNTPGYQELIKNQRYVQTVKHHTGIKRGKTMIEKQEKIKISGIVKHKDGLGFKITFKNQETANKYKDMIRWILAHEKYPVEYKIAYYDTFNRDGYENE